MRELCRGAHFGEGKMLGRLKEHFYWSGCSEAAREWCKGCVLGVQQGNCLLQYKERAGISCGICIACLQGPG